MKINLDMTRSYRNSNNCYNTQLTPDHIYPAILAALYMADIIPEEDIHTNKAPLLAGIFRTTIIDIYVSGYSTSVVALVISLVIFFYFNLNMQGGRNNGKTIVVQRTHEFKRLIETPEQILINLLTHSKALCELEATNGRLAAIGFVNDGNVLILWSKYIKCAPSHGNVVCRSLQCTRITLHKNLFLSFIVNNIMWIYWYTEIIPHPEVIQKSTTGCQVLHVVVHYFLVSNYFWMFCEGLYLHTLLVVAFVSESRLLKWFYLLGWGKCLLQCRLDLPTLMPYILSTRFCPKRFPAVIIAIYAGTRSNSTEDVKYCWMEESVYTWIISGPVCISMAINVVFLVNIVRVLWTKLKAVNSPDTHQTRQVPLKAARATLILIPLLGLHYILIPFRPENTSPLEAVYETLSAIGLCVSLLFCFFNGEVMTTLRKSAVKYCRDRYPSLVPHSTIPTAV
ncbi:CALCRL [Cordylochernes scorpioides]|uniref:CALCRL n=1 Tax=Cordylochernes scorpioides TaxID=51811 RepID=A0ABY6L451_9ARAC|nr:CALCRL [Cordylochernes scorpioides]